VENTVSFVQKTAAALAIFKNRDVLYYCLAPPLVRSLAIDWSKSMNLKAKIESQNQRHKNLKAKLNADTTHMQSEIYKGEERGDATGEGWNSAVWWAHTRTREDNRGGIFSPHRFPRELEGFPDRGAAERVASPSGICDEVIAAAAAEQRRREPQHGQGDQAVLQGGDADPPDEEEFPPGLALFVPSWIVLNVPPSCSLLLLAVSRKKRLPMLVSTSPLNLVSQHFSSLSSPVFL
jgi:hypothetical protein